MNTSIELTNGKWILLNGSRMIVPTLLRMIGQLAEAGPVRVVDGGCMFDIIVAFQNTGRNIEIAERIQVSSATDCHQMLSILENMDKGSAPFVVLDLLRTFNYTNVDFKERSHLLNECLEQLDRLAESSGGLVSVHVPNVLCQAERELLDMVIVAAGYMNHVEMAGRIPAEMRVS
ncbi:MAG: hypothetical protein ABSA01_16905 [Anaerolineales bacterium]|jgi:hypothetical protein